MNIGPVRLAGNFFQGGNLVLCALGGYHFNLSEFAGSAAWVAAAEMLRWRGDDDPKWVARSYVTSIVGIGLINYDALMTVNIGDLATLSSPAAGTAIGTGVFAVAYGIGAFSNSLAQKFKAAKNIAVRYTAGRPRTTASALACVSMAPMIKDAIAQRSMVMGFVLSCYCIGEALLAVSSPDKPIQKAETSPQTALTM
jgi:hypothetical protein